MLLGHVAQLSGAQGADADCVRVHRVQGLMLEHDLNGEGGRRKGSGAPSKARRFTHGLVLAAHGPSLGKLPEKLLPGGAVGVREGDALDRKPDRGDPRTLCPTALL